VFHTAEILDCL